MTENPASVRNKKNDTDSLFFCYILGFVAAFVPVFNIIFFFSSVVFICVGLSDDEITFSGWLFKEI